MIPVRSAENCISNQDRGAWLLAGKENIATTHAIVQGAEVVGEAYRLAGQNAIFENARFERRLRDANAVSQQVQGRQTHYATVGRVLLGLDPDSTMFL